MHDRDHTAEKTDQTVLHAKLFGRKVDTDHAVPEYDVSMYTHKKSKSTAESSLRILEEVLPLLENLKCFDNDSLFEVLSAYASENALKVNTVMWPLRTAVSGKQATPAGATGIMELIGREETIQRLLNGIEKLKGAAERSDNN